MVSYSLLHAVSPTIWTVWIRPCPNILWWTKMLFDNQTSFQTRHLNLWKCDPLGIEILDTHSLYVIKKMFCSFFILYTTYILQYWLFDYLSIFSLSLRSVLTLSLVETKQSQNIFTILLLWGSFSLTLTH